MFFFFFNDTATTEIYTLSLHDALPIFEVSAEETQAKEAAQVASEYEAKFKAIDDEIIRAEDRKSTRLNSSHANISYAVFCLKKKNIYYNVYTMNYIINSILIEIAIINS